MGIIIFKIFGHDILEDLTADASHFLLNCHYGLLCVFFMSAIQYLIYFIYRVKIANPVRSQVKYLRRDGSKTFTKSFNSRFIESYLITSSSHNTDIIRQGFLQDNRRMGSYEQDRFSLDQYFPYFCQHK